MRRRLYLASHGWHAGACRHDRLAAYPLFARHRFARPASPVPTQCLTRTTMWNTQVQLLAPVAHPAQRQAHHGEGFMSASQATAVRGAIPKHPLQITGQPLSELAADTAALKALVQAAVNVELFTIPLYMCTMTSIQGTHAINASGISYYKGRVWPGMATAVVPAGDTSPATAPQRAYNLLFSVFIDEMLHLQMAANICNAVGVQPNFNSPLLQDADYNWICYGPTQTVIPHVLDLRDLKDPSVGSNLTVQLSDLNENQVTLFTLIEEDHAAALARIKPDPSHAYFSPVPFANWTAQSKETDLPLFGTIGWMYYSLYRYMTIKYEDGQLLWEKLFVGPVGQWDLFNSTAKSAEKEYPLMPTQITAKAAVTAGMQAITMMAAICDQGEGGIDASTTHAFLHMLHTRALEIGMSLADINSVIPTFQPDKAAMANNHPSYTDTGLPAASTDADARGTNGALDHHQRFENLLGLVGQVQTWSQWHATKGNVWTCEMLTTSDFNRDTAPTNIPSPDNVADALNNLKKVDPTALDNVAQGALAGITTVLSKSWGATDVQFPYPSMVGSGDRLGLYWAIYGSAPTLQKVTGNTQATGTLLHACQGLSLDGADSDCAAPAIYHSCKGSNHCATEGGCGFVQSVQGGGSCSQAIGGGCGQRVAAAAQAAARAAAGEQVGGTCGAPKLFSAPANNKCAGFGGCAVPISASQLYPEAGTMQVFDFTGSDNTPTPLTTQAFAVGDSVYDTAWKAYETVLAERKLPPATKPTPTDLRIALPPST
ncbi:MAG: ferritin-like domain-containing protein [Xanthomonas sp.]